MEQYCIISGTNRPGSQTLRVARHYEQELQRRGQPVHFLSLENWTTLLRDNKVMELEERLLIPSSRFIFVSPEYNGSIPGILKLMIDVTDHRKVWSGKKALLTGVSAGRAGNLRGMDHLTGILHYLQVVVHPNKLPISSIDRLLDGDGRITDKATLDVISRQLDAFLAF